MNSPKEVMQNYIAIGLAKTKYTAAKMLILGAFAGLFLGFAGAGATIVSATVAGTAAASAGKLLGALVFPAGLAMILIAGGELFTGNNLIIISVLEKQAKIGAMLKNWLFVYIGNLIGSLAVAAVTVYGGTYSLFGNAAAVGAIGTAVAKSTLPFGEALLRGISCNVLVCIAVFMALAAKDVAGKIAALFFPIMLFVLSGYEHSVANMYFIPAGILAAKNVNYSGAYSAAYNPSNLSSLTWGAMFVKNLIPVTLGNIIGGTGIVGALYWFIHLHEPVKKAPAKKTKKKK